jgi:hypothetical protein
VGSSTFTCSFAPSVVAIYEGSEWVGSGVVVGQSMILTAYHVVVDPASYYVRGHRCVGGTIERVDEVLATLETFSAEADLAFLSTISIIGVPAKLGMPRRDTTVWLYSSSRWGSRGTIRQLFVGYIGVSGIALKGDSGGAIIDEMGRVVGIVQRSDWSVPHYSGYAPILGWL